MVKDKGDSFAFFFYHNRSIIHRLEYFILVFCYSLEEEKKVAFKTLSLQGNQQSNKLC